MAATEVVPMLDATPVAEASTDIEIPSLDQAVETPAAEVPEVEADAKVETKTEEKPAVDPAEASAQITPKVINSQLQELAKTNKPLAIAIHAKVADGLRLASLLKETGTANVQELKAKLSAPDSKIQEQLDAVSQTDELLYRGDLKELTTNIWTDVERELGKEAPARIGELAESLYAQLKESNPEIATQHQRSVFLDTAEHSGLFEVTNKLSAQLASGDVEGAKSLVSQLVKFFKNEISAEQAGAKTRETATAERTKTTEQETAAQRDIQTTANKEADSLSNRTLGAALGELIRGPLKSLDRPALEKLSVSIKTELHEELKADGAYMTAMDKLWKQTKTPEGKTALLARHDEKLKSIAKGLVSKVAAKEHPALMAPKPAPPKAPASIKTTINGKPADAVIFKARPANLLHKDIVWHGQDLTSRDLETLQASRQQGFVVAKDGKTPVLVTWKAGVK